MSIMRPKMNGKMWQKRDKKGWQKREKVKFSQKTWVKVGCFWLVFEESWGKVGGFLKKVAIFEKGLSRFCHGWIS